MAQQSRFGYLLSEPLPLPTTQLPTSVLLQLTAADNKEIDLQQLWSIESTGIDS